MSETAATLVKVVPRISDLDPGQWDACANPDPATHNPFLSHAFLAALEEAGTTGRGTGWLPQHVAIADQSGELQAVLPLYAKTHSQGEFVFDHAWADAYGRAGGAYYPKLQAAVPFTPVPGRRLLVRAGADVALARSRLASAAVAICQRVEASSVHMTFLTEPEWSSLGELGYLQRTGQQFHWFNRGYATFEDFLGSLASRKRKAIRKERAEAVADGLTIRHLTGREITEADWDAFYAFYVDTGSRKWGQPYLNRAFFSLLGTHLSDRCLLVFACRGDRPVAGALNMIGGDGLYGRYWGTVEHHPFLHFELCYYQAIEYAIAKGLPRVEAGAQGDHKLARGYEPVVTYSAHWIVDPRLRAAVARFLVQERAAIEQGNKVLTELGPYKKG